MPFITFNFQPVCISCAAVCGIFILALYIIFGGEWIDLYLSIIFLVLSLYKLFFERYVISIRRYKFQEKAYGVSEWKRTIEFLDDNIYVVEATTKCNFYYSSIFKIKEKNNKIFIYFKNKSLLRLYKDTFVEGTWEECKKFIEKRI